MKKSKNQIETLEKLHAEKLLEPYIRYIRYPYYKNLEPNTKIDFTYPITVLVGANGTNKSSILRSLYGAPQNNNLGTFWFSTKTDPIEEIEDKPNCFIYGYWNSNAQEIVEVLKTRIKKEGDPDYWEPSRPITNYGMKKIEKIPSGAQVPKGRSRTRWNAIQKNVVFLDFRSSLSAFDKFFYHGELHQKPNTEKNRKEFIRGRATPLKRALDEGMKTFIYRRKERIIDSENKSLPKIARDEISKILGREYTEIKLVKHTFFNCDAYTCQMKVAGLKYTEAFAGSGEFAVTRIVTSVLSAQSNSLILLDEPEVSLHPGAQDRLIDFLRDSVIQSKHQVIISTHSPTIVRKLPPDAIKVFVMNNSSGYVSLPKQSSLAEEAFFHLGEEMPERITIIVEDRLAKSIVERALLLNGESIANVFNIIYFPGGSQTLWAHHLPIYADENRSKLLVLFDGDQRPDRPLLNQGDIPTNQSQKLQEEILRISKVEIKFKIDGGNDKNETGKMDMKRRNFIDWVKNHVDYLPGKQTPEDLIWTNMKLEKDINQISGGDPKTCFEKLTKMELGLPNVNSDDIFQTQRRCLATIPIENTELLGLQTMLIKFARRVGISC